MHKEKWVLNFSETQICFTINIVWVTWSCNIILPRVLIIDFFQPFWLEQMGNIGSIAQSTKSWCQLGISSLICFFCSPYARRLGFHGKTNALMWLLILLLHYFGAHSKNEHHWEQFDGEGKKISGGIGGRKSAPVLDRCYTLLHVSFTYVYMYLSSIVLY